MLRSIKEIVGYQLMASDGKIGRCDDFLFEDRPWVVRYVVANTTRWLKEHQVLISLVALAEPDWMTRLLHVNLTKQQIEESPPLDDDAPVSKQTERQSFLYYGWPAYWENLAQKKKKKESSLRSANEVIGYRAKTAEEPIGKISDFIVEDGIWAIRYIIVRIHDIPGGKKVLIAPEWVNALDYLNQSARIDLTKDQINACPEYDPTKPINRDYETILYDYYGRPYYWTTETNPGLNPP